MTELRGHASPEELLAAAGGRLYDDEAGHTTLISAVERLRSLPPSQRPAATLLTVERGGTVEAIALRTPPRSLLLSRGIAPEGLDALVGHLRVRDPGLPGVFGTVADASGFARRWARVTGTPARERVRMRLLGCQRVEPPEPVGGRMRDATGADRAVLVDWLEAFTGEALQHEPRPLHSEDAVDALLEGGPAGVVVWEDGGRPVSMAAYVNAESGAASPRVATVYTPRSLRRRGYASACVAGLTARLHAAGHRRVVLFADLANSTSNRIYTTIGYRPIADFAEHALQSG